MIVLEKAYETETGNRVEYYNPDETKRSCRCPMGFMDTNYIMFKMENLGFDGPVENMLEEAKKNIEVCQHLVHITGGELDLTENVTI